MDCRGLLTKLINFVPVVVVGFSLSTASCATGQVLWSNPVDGNNPNATNPFNIGDVVPDSNVTIGSLSRGGGINGSNANNRFNANNWTVGTGYFEWGLTPAAGFALDFSSLTGVWRRSSTGPNAYAFRSSLDDFSSDVIAGEITGSASDVPFSLSLESSLFDVITSAVTFRLYATGASGATGTFSINDFSFNGTVFPFGGPLPTSPGDFNGDGVADAADYTVWRDTLGQSTELGINNNGDGQDISSSDYDLWSINFGNTFPGGALSGTDLVPEPTSIALLCGGIAILTLRRARRA